MSRLILVTIAAAVLAVVLWCLGRPLEQPVDDYEAWRFV